MQTKEERLEKARVRSAEWRENNREKHRAYTREYRKKHSEERYKKNREWALANKELVNSYHRKSRESNPDSYREITRRYRANHPGFSANRCVARRARKNGAGGTVTIQDWQNIVKIFGGNCAACSRKTRLSMDHIVPLSKGGRHSPENIQPLCIPCNSSKSTKTIDYRITSQHFNADMFKEVFGWTPILA